MLAPSLITEMNSSTIIDGHINNVINRGIHMMPHIMYNTQAVAYTYSIYYVLKYLKMYYYTIHDALFNESNPYLIV